MATLTGLSGIKRENMPCEMFRTAYDVIGILRKGAAATTAGDNGAINVWRDDEGKYRCEAHRNCSSLCLEIFDTQPQVVAWLKVWLKNIA